MKKIGIIGAMDVEVNLLLEKIQKDGGYKKTEAGSLAFYEGNLCGCSVVIVKSGIGKVNAALCAQRLIIQFGVDCIINSGIAGCMAKGLGVFDFAVSTEAVYHDVDVTTWGYKCGQIPQMKTSVFEADKKLIDFAKSAFEKSELAAKHKIMLGRIASGDQFICDPALKALIKERMNPICVEMEGAAIAHACWLNGIPFVILRCISDMADDSQECTYEFNEKAAAEESSCMLMEMLKEMSA
ncbi:MAG: 5'-methylthioadenosine/adenosylhomocysteine nucleosidase [Treponema sp.]|nr:5'-methylthioadenosine/adenosylhomocysteine nucleosidase [Treponema sp.]